MVLHDDASGNRIRKAAPYHAPKRHATMWNNYGAGRSPKKRSTRACLSCRSRKVRCDVINGGTPCTNCRLDDVDCVLKESKRGRKPDAAAPSSLSVSTYSPNVASATSLPGVPERQQQQQQAQEQEQDQPDSPLQEDSPSQQPQQSGPSPTDRLASWSDDNPISHPTQDQYESPTAGEPVGDVQVQPQHDQSQSRQVSPDEIPSNSPIASVRQYGSGNGTPKPGESPPRLPLYIRPIPRHLDSNDLEYMSTKRCLEVPDDEFRDELLRVYISIIHPFLPAIDLDRFIDPILRNDGHNPISLLLFQAAMFASVTFVDIQFLQRGGYASRRAARKDFFDRVRILHGLNYESDRLTLLRSLLLLTYWYDCPDDDKDTWYWMGIALTTAQAVGLHRSPDSLNISPQEKHLRRRLWWCCVMRDRLLALGIRSPPRIRDHEYNVSQLTLDDFDLCTPSPLLAVLFLGSRWANPDVARQRTLAVMCIELSRLCVAIGHTLNTLYTVMGSYHGGSEYLSKPAVRPKLSEAKALSLAKCGAELEDWLQMQSLNSQYVPGTREHLSGPLGKPQTDNIVRLHRAQLHMIYLAVLGALHRPQVFCDGLDYGVNGFRKAASQRQVTDAAVDMIKLSFDLERNDLLRYLTTLAVPAYLAVALVHLLSTRSHDEEVRNLSLGRLCQCIHVLQQLQEIYASADYAIKFINAVLRNTGIHIPVLLSRGMPTNETVESNHRAATTHRSSLDLGPSHVAATCMYPSPSASGDMNQASIDEPDETQPGGVQLHVVQQLPQQQQQQQQQQPISFPSVAEMWVTAGHAEQGDMLLQPDLQTVPWPWGSWGDVDSWAPALMYPEGDAEIFMATDAHISPMQ